jgi:hypothetical protein
MSCNARHITNLRTFNPTLGFEISCQWHELHLLLPYIKLKHKLCFSNTDLSCSRKAHHMTVKLMYEASFYSENHVTHNMYSVKVRLWSCILFTNISWVRILSINIRLGYLILVTVIIHTCMYIHTHAHTYPHTYSIEPLVYRMACGYEISHNTLKTWLYTTRNSPKLCLAFHYCD